MRPARRGLAALSRDYLPIATVLVVLVAGANLLTSPGRTRRSGPPPRMIESMPDQSSVAPSLARSALGSRVSSLTLVILAVFAAALWVNAGINAYRFNFAISVLGSIPLAFVVLRARVIRA